MAKQIGQRNDGRSHGPIFMRPLRPRNALFRIDPNRETHCAYGLFVKSTCASTGMPFRSTLTVTVSPGLCARSA